MTVTPDPAELAPTRDPEAYARRPLLTGGFWVMMVFCALCLAAAAVVVVLGPRLTAVRRAASVATSPVMAAAPASAPPQLAPAAPIAAPMDLASRVQRLEGSQTRALNAAAGALAASALSDAAAKPSPFAADLTAVARVLPGSPDAMALAALAQQGAPTRAALAVQLTDLGGDVSTAARAPGKNASFMDRAFYAFSRVVSVRRMDAHAVGADAVLAGAERKADDGDLEGAVAALDALPEPARARLAGWREKAVRRIEIDRHIAGLRAQAIANLAEVQGAAS